MSQLDDLRIHMHGQVEAEVKDNIASPPLLPFWTPQMQVIRRNIFLSSIKRAASFPGAVEEKGNTAVEPTLSTNVAHVAQAEWKLQRPTKDSFDSIVDFTAASLSHSTLELKYIVLNRSETCWTSLTIPYDSEWWHWHRKEVC